MNDEDINQTTGFMLLVHVALIVLVVTVGVLYIYVAETDKESVQQCTTEVHNTSEQIKKCEKENETNN